MEKIRVADWSTCPGPRYRNEGEYSAEEFRDDVLLPKLRGRDVMCDEGVNWLKVDLDGNAGICGGWLEEVFGGLVRVCGLEEDDFRTLWIVSKEDKSYEFEAEDAIAKALKTKDPNYGN